MGVKVSRPSQSSAAPLSGNDSAAPVKPSVLPSTKPSVLGPRTTKNVAVPIVSLPTELSVPSTSLGDYSILMYGEKKIGKTSLASKFPGAMFLMFEPGGKGLSIYQTPVATWEEFKAYVQLLKADERFQTLVIDTVDIAYERCFDYVCRMQNIEHPSDVNDFGKTWSLITNEFQKTMLELVSAGKGMIFLSHATEKDFASASGLTYNKIVATMPARSRQFITGFVDIICYYGYYGNHRMLTVQGSDAVDSGNRLENNFLVKGGTAKIHSIPMGSSAQEGYNNILKAFANQQEDAYEPDKKDTARLADKVAPPKKR